MPTTGYAIGAESSNASVSYIDEVTWGTLPATPTFNRLRITGESLTSNKGRQRAAEIDATRQASDMVTTSIGAGGTINGVFSVGTFDDLFESLFCSTFATDIMTNGTSFQSIYLQKQLGTGLFFRYPGSFVSGANISASLGGMVTCSFNVLSQQELKSATDAATGYAVANTNRVVDTVSMISAINVGGVSAGKVESLSLDIANDGAAALYAMGSSAAQGVLPGVFTVSGRVRIYFNDFTLYDRYTNETAGAFEFLLTDGTKSTKFEVLSSVLMNPNIVAGGPGQPILADFSIEGRKESVSGKTMRITRDLT